MKETLGGWFDMLFLKFALVDLCAKHPQVWFAIDDAQVAQEKLTEHMILDSIDSKSPAT